MRDPQAVLGHGDTRAAGLDLAAPACVTLACVLHFVDAQTARGIVAAFMAPLAPGSYVIISVGFAKGEDGQDFARTYNAQDGARIYAHTWDEISALFDGLELVPPGLVETSAWQPGRPPADHEEQASMIVAGVGRRP